MMCGSVCKDFSSMGKQAGLSGQWVLLSGIMLALVKKVKPLMLLHECTRTYPFELFEQLLPGYTDFHAILDPVEFGAPVKRSRSYDAVVTWFCLSLVLVFRLQDVEYIPLIFDFIEFVISH